MLMRTLYIICIVSFLYAADATAQRTDSLSVLERVSEHGSCLLQSGCLVYSNPALRQFMQDFSYTTVGVGYCGEKQTEAVSRQAGKGYSRMFFDADTHIKYKNATLWGEGYYATGHQRSPVWNEVADAELVYPYLTADAAGGDISNETYKFAGGYSSYDGRVAWGAALGYTAGHHYRDVDPRPRNVTGRLDIAAGIGFRITGKYIIALGGEFMKYKQTSDIDFKSELGQTTVYHLTGLGTDYTRFCGNGFTTNYDGERYGLQMDITPEDGNGLSGTLRLSRLTMETILNDMNKLPLNDIRHNTLEAELGYKHRGNTAWGVFAGCYVYRRHGRENIFGDAASSTYPQIGTVEMYADNAWRMAARGFVEHSFGTIRLSYEPMLGCSHRCQVYAEPAREWLIDNWWMSHSIKAGRMFGSRWHGTVEFGWRTSYPVSSRFVMEDDECANSELLDAVCSDFMYASSVQRSYMVRAVVRYAPGRNNALQLSADYRHDSYAASTKGNIFCISAGVVF